MSLTMADASKLLLDGALALAEMENNGICIDVPYLESTIASLDRKAKRITDSMQQSEVYETWRRQKGPKTNLSSRAQLCEILFDEMKLPYDEDRFPRTSTGRHQSSEEVIAFTNHPFCHDWVKRFKITNLRTKMNSLLRDTINGRFHIEIKLHSARTFRSSAGKSEETEGKSYNFQATPHRDEDQSKRIRRAFIPSKGNMLTEVDMSAWEWRIAGCVWEDPEIIRYVKEGHDPHREQAAEMFRCKPRHVSGAMRHLGKNGFVFPILYGSYYRSVAANVWRDMEGVKLANTEVTVRDHLKLSGIHNYDEFESNMEKVEKRFRAKFKVFAERSDAAWEEYLRRGEFDIITGFRVWGVYTKNKVLNYKVQSAAWHGLLKGGIIEMTRRLHKYHMKTMLVGTIHDSVESDGPEKEVPDYLSMFQEVMCEWLPKQWPWLICPLAIEAKVSPRNWYEQELWTEENGRWRSVK